MKLLAAATFALVTLATAAPVKLILDTDFESDVDDVAAVALAHAYEDAGKVEIIGMALSTANKTSAPALQATNAWFGRPEIPLGVRKTGVDRKSVYTETLVKKFPAEFDAAKAPDAVKLYRKLLAAAEDKSVVIVSLGYLTNLADLLDSPADDLSPLTGMELVEKKVIRYVCMGGSYPSQKKTGNWGNFLPDPKAVIRVNNDWPTPVIYTGGSDFSRKIMTGGAFADLPASSLVATAYRTFFEKSGWAKGPTQHSADLIAVYVAINGTEPFFHETKQGRSHIFENGTMQWEDEPDDPRRSHVASFPEGVTGEQIAKEFDRVIVEAEKKRVK